MSSETSLYEKRILELEKKLQQSIYDLNRSKKENEEFIHIASHDLQAPLRKLSSFVERLTHKSRDVLTEDMQLYLDKIESTVTAMRSLIDDLSVISGISTANVEFVKCDVNEIMKQLVRDFESALKVNSPGIAISSLPVLEANAAQLKNAFKNIIDNSIKFQDKTKALQIAIRSEIVTIDEKIAFNLPVDKIYFKIEFSDNGIGFNPENIDKILQPFQRLHGKSDYPGNGLGLTICKKIIENHRGIIYAMGNEFSGTRFILILPETHD